MFSGSCPFDFAVSIDIQGYPGCYFLIWRQYCIYILIRIFWAKIDYDYAINKTITLA